MDLNRRCFFVITGASRGIGKTMAIHCCKKFKSGSLAVLLARSADGLEATKNEILSVINNEITIKTFPIDLSDATEKDFDNIITTSLNDIDIGKNFDFAFIIHNVGSVGDVSKKAKELSDIDLWTNYYKLNVFSVICLNSVFMKHLNQIQNLIVNITSKTAIQPFKSMALYCSGKSAREMYFRVLAEEEQPIKGKKNNIVVLNYSPGPVDTDMALEVEENTSDNGLRNYFKEQRETKNILSTIQTTIKFLYIVENYKYNSGDHVDYYD